MSGILMTSVDQKRINSMGDGRMITLSICMWIYRFLKVKEVK